ncbi:DUF5959 family protein [Streptomyces sp. NPDC059874]|uniref:DUF5959 family protein n=1 Tax=Streptomyces sp. NPDC059874 TaxID=3346983 RepID=UPI003669D206
MAEPTVLDLIRLEDKRETSGHRVVVRVLGRYDPGVLSGHDFLDAEIVVTTPCVSATFDVTLLPDDLEQWETALDALEAGTFVYWLTSGRTPSLKIEPISWSGFVVSVHDGPASGVTVTVPLSNPTAGLIYKQRDLLEAVRRAYPQQVIETRSGRNWYRPEA